MVDTPKYRAFISYSHSDQKVARWLHRAIETYRVPSSIVGHEGAYGPIPRRLGKVFRDEEELAGAAQLGPKLEEPLRASEALIVICSPKAAQSRWVNHEIRFFKTVNPGKPVLAVIAEGDVGGELSCFPECMLYGVTPEGEVDRNLPIEPLAPDLQKMDHTTVKLKLIAGLLGVGYDDLARRDLKRTRRQAALIGAITTTVIVALASLAIAAFGYARYAVKQEKIARAAQQQEAAARKVAEEARKVAEDQLALQLMMKDAALSKQGLTLVPDANKDCECKSAETKAP